MIRHDSPVHHRRFTRSLSMLATFALAAGATVLVPRAAASPTIASYPTTPQTEGITSGPDGALWFTEPRNGIGRITTSGSITEYPIPSVLFVLPQDIAAGPDGALWFTELAGGNIGRITISGSITEYPCGGCTSQTYGIAAGPDGALWFGNGPYIGRITTSGGVTEYPIPSSGAYAQPITAGPDGALWFAETQGNNIGRITTSGSITEYPIPTPNSQPFGIATGPDGALWFTGSGIGIGRITTSGSISQPFSVSSPQEITEGPDGNLWFTYSPGIGQITGLNTPPTASVVNTSLSGNEGSAISVSGTAGDVDGDTVTTAWTVAPIAGDDPGAACTVAAPASLTTSLTCNDEGTYSLTLTATDSAGQTATATATVTVANAPPSVGAISLPVSPVAVNTAVTGSATFSDPGTLDGHTASWNWGDATTSAGTVTETVGSGTGSVSGSHTFTTAGVYTVSLTVSDADGVNGTNTFDFVVVFDPSAGFIAGGGWINSPTGAYVANPSATGKANFGFVSKYQKGATVPSGNTEFQFQTANLDFQSSAYQWLVITGQCRGQFKGTGVINGGGSYMFILTAVDGERCANPGPDTFRIQITDNNNNNRPLVYDNGSDQPIGGGDITVHTS